MKKIFLLTALFLQFTFAFGQERDEVGHRVTPWVIARHGCFNGLEWKVRKSYYSDNSDNFINEIEIKNKYSSKITFSFDVSADANAKTTQSRKTLNPGETTRFTRVQNVDFVYLYIADVCFNSDNRCTGTCYALCDNGTPNIPNDCGGQKSNSNNNSAGQTTNDNTSTSRPNDLTEYNRSKADLERQMAEKNAEGQAKSQNYTQAMNAGIAAHNSGDYTEAKRQFSIALNNCNTEEARKKAQEYYNKSVNTAKEQSKIQTSIEVLNAAKPLANAIDNIIAENRQRKAEKQAEDKRIEEKKSNEIINNQDYYFRITSEDDNEMGEYCDYIVSKFQKAGYSFVEITSPTFKKYNTDGIQQAFKDVSIYFKNEKDTLNFRMLYHFTLGKYVNSFVRRCWLTSKKLKYNQTINIAKEIFSNTIEPAKNSDENACFDFLLNPEVISNSLTNDNFNSTNYKGYAIEFKKAGVPKTDENIKSYLSNGYIYYQKIQIGQGNENDFTQAIFWYKKAADSLNTVAMRFLTDAYFKKDNYEIAEQWTLKAIQLGDKYAYTNLGALYNSAGQTNTAIIWYKKAVEADQASGYYSLGMSYFDGKGVEKDGKEAERLLLIGANKNDYSCMSGLELLYKYGCKGVGKSKSKANDWYEKKCKAYPQYCK